MEPVMFMPTTLAGHMAKHCNRVVNSPDENNKIGGVYRNLCFGHNEAFWAVLGPGPGPPE